ncbi:MAG: tRNA (adenosine(37)-N6)-dimethylallyltransferase MiaA [Clostridia bacterium]|nr:tRNA (adenosine(37)-N6)-dimethylallyltransferase MiaA [Clostridia bacterium]
MRNLIVIEGTNASGKSGLGVALASLFGGEVISADSRQVFRGLDLGSGKITLDEMRGVPHHLLDVCGPGCFFSMADYQRLAYAAVEDILDRGKLPFLVGGTGLYVDSVADGYLLSDRAPDLKYRAELEKLTTPELYGLLQKTLPGWEVDKNNRNRVMRVLEKHHDGDLEKTGRAPRYRVLRLGVTWDRETLKKRIDERLDRRFEEGMLDEVKGLLDSGVTREFLDGLGLEYRFITRYLTGEIPDFDDMKEQLSLAIKRFARRQMTWFRRHQDVVWLDMGADPVRQGEEAIRAFLESAPEGKDVE